MKTFLKILLLVAVVFLIVKLCPVLVAVGLIGMVAAGIIGVAGLSVLAVLFAILVGVAIVLSPIWVPILAVVGLISLFRGSKRVAA